MRRREFLAALSGLAAAPLLADMPRRRHILLANCWHDINIGDIAHAPGLLELLSDFYPNVGVTLWPCPTTRGDQFDRDLTPEVRQMLLRRFPELTILKPGVHGQENGAVRADLVAAIRRSDVFVLGSGGYHGEPVEVWRKSTDKPFGIYGVTLSNVRRPGFAEAKFIYCRDSVSTSRLQESGLTGPVMEFAPDSTFGLQVRDDEQALKFLGEHGLEDRRFLCAIPRFRTSPYHTIYGLPPTAQDLEIDRINAEHKAADHAALREAIVNWVRTTGMKVLACPEMTYGVPLSKEQLVDPLPDDVRAQVVWRDRFWLCDEAASVFARARAVISLDCHSPIIALAAGTPAIHLRVATDNPHKSRMFADIGLPEWIHECDDVTGAQLTTMLMEIHERFEEALLKVRRAMAFVRERQAATMATIGRVLVETARTG